MEKPRKGKLAGTPVTYEDSFKIAVAREYLEGKQSQAALGRKYGLTSGEVVRYFVNWYKNNIDGNQLTTPADNNTDQGLQEELRLANLKITALEMMINIAEKELEIDIRKKSGTKPSAK